MAGLVKKSMLRVAALAGTPLVESSLATYDVLEVLGHAVKVVPQALGSANVLVERFDVLIIRATRLVAVASFSAGAVMAMQFGAGMGRFGAKTYVPTVVATAVVQALAPMLANLMAAARSGGGLAAEVAGMVLTQQIDALRALGSDPYRKIHAPSMMALTLGLPMLALIAMLAGLAGGLAVEVTTLGLPLSQAWAKTITAIHPLQASLALAKTAVGGLVIGLVATREGLRAEGGTSGIGAATTAAVIRATIGVLLADLILTKLIWVLT